MAGAVRITMCLTGDVYIFDDFCVSILSHILPVLEMENSGSQIFEHINGSKNDAPSRT